ncbi:hypothetical protein VPH35_050311 [Triticum aestivum]|uniref:Uncharacterized protein n=2 Tax=Triticum TaxID=4564 RepID=A0A9R1RY17_TRITD|nr:unnamed protein product [Triticum aestivum]VAH73363.1 unnamed protein product [Triticum turgidum subsp. durum]
MGWVLGEVLRLYPPSPNMQRQALHDITIDDAGTTNSRGTNMAVVLRRFELAKAPEYRRLSWPWPWYILPPPRLDRRNAPHPGRGERRERTEERYDRGEMREDRGKRRRQWAK